MPDPQLIQVKKYPNRRLYDRTRSRHLTHEELYDLVVAGHTVSVTDSKTDADITNLVLAQALIERSPEKFASFPPELFHLMIRASEQMLRGFATSWFAQVMKGVGPMGVPIGMPGMPMGMPMGTPNAGFAWPFAPTAATQPQVTQPTQSPQSNAAPQPDVVADLQARVEAMMREIANLKKSSRK